MRIDNHLSIMDVQGHCTFMQKKPAGHPAGLQASLSPSSFVWELSPYLFDPINGRHGGGTVANRVVLPYQLIADVAAAYAGRDVSIL
jgi:hypothetical protein